MENIKAVIFDLDGTLTNTLNAIAHFGNLALNAYNLPSIPTEDYKYHVGDGRDKLIHRMLAVTGNDSDEMFEKVGAVYDENYEKDFLYDTDAYDGIRELLKELKKRGLKIAVCTNKPDNVAHFVVETIFGKGTFDIISGVKKGGATKPDPKAALQIADAFGIERRECIFMGDTNVDIRTAVNADMNSVGVLWGFRDEAELKQAGAEHIIRKPSELLDLLGGK